MLLVLYCIVLFLWLVLMRIVVPHHHAYLLFFFCLSSLLGCVRSLCERFGMAFSIFLQSLWKNELRIWTFENDDPSNSLDLSISLSPKFWGRQSLSFVPPKEFFPITPYYLYKIHSPHKKNHNSRVFTYCGVHSELPKAHWMDDQKL